MKALTAALFCCLALLATVAVAEEQPPNEMVMINADDQETVLTAKVCEPSPNSPVVLYEAYATDKDGQVHFGCWNRSGPMVNVIWQDIEGIYTYHARLFKPR